MTQEIKKTEIQGINGTEVVAEITDTNVTRIPVKQLLRQKEEYEEKIANINAILDAVK